MASASDDFNRADAGSLGVAWNGGCKISNNRATGVNGGAFNADWYVGVSFNTDHNSQITISGGANADNAVAARVQDASNFYMLYNQGSGGVLLFKRVGGSFTSLNNFGGTVNVGDTLKLECIGTAIHCYQNGSELTGSPVTDATFSGGSPGIVVFSNSTASGVDDWIGADVGGGATGVAIVSSLAMVGAM